jgi:hypothetical protein
MASCDGGSSIFASGFGRNFGSSVSKQTMSRELRALNYRKLSARPRHHAQAAGAIEDFKKPVAGRGPPAAIETRLIS